MRLDGKTIVITGANGALGKHVVEIALELGASVKAMDLHFENTTLENSNQCQLIPVNLLESDTLQQITSGLGSVDALCNIAGGFAMGTDVHETPADEFQKMYDINVNSMLNTCSSIIPTMLAQAKGSIINVGAKGALQGAAGMGAYIASKSAVMRLTECMSEELKHKGIRVNAVLPTMIDTPANRAAMPDEDHSAWVSPDELATAMLFLASDSASGITGSLIPVSGRL
ncbi:MAG: SDR family NAD(P)-dependent oxidoreductase [Gammaproteobacteria bacterium]|nr:SDR family NAD(P)-dependent oxidoreductase [Gammaproteobacteria bacterium]